MVSLELAPGGAARKGIAWLTGLRADAAATSLVLASYGASTTALRRRAMVLTACGRHVSERRPSPKRQSAPVPRGTPRPACGQPKTANISSLFNVIIALDLHRRGHRASAHRAVRPHAIPYQGLTESFIDITLRGETPGADPSHQKRGPYRSPRIGR